MTIDFNDAPRQAPPSVEDATARKARVEARLKARAWEFVAYLYPRAVRRGHTARVGDTTGAPGESLAIELEGERCGLWTDHANGADRGDLFTLYAAALNLDPKHDFAKILAECDAWLGGSPSLSAKERHKREKAKPPPPSEREEIVGVFPYLAADGAKLFDVCRIEYRDEQGHKVICENGKAKKIYRPRRLDGSWGYPPGRWPLYRIPDITRAHDVVLVEGEKCADALHAAGIIATSAPGGSSAKVENIDWSALAGKSVTAWPDNDEPGRQFMVRVAAHLKSLGCSVQILAPPAGKPAKWDAADAVAEGFDVNEYLRSSATAENAGSEIRHELWAEIQYHYEPELVEELFPRVGLATLYGPSTVGKSFVALDWMSTIAANLPLLGRDTESVGVLYLAFEGFHGIKKRIQGIKQERGFPNLAFELVDAPWTLSDDKQGPAFRAFVDQAKQRLEDTGFGLGVIVVDTLTSAFAGADANSQAEVSAAMKDLKRIAVDLDCLVLVIGHTGKNTANGMAGSFAFKSESDTFIELRAADGGAGKPRSIYVEKVKDGASGYEIATYSLREVRIGTKPNGKPITTCIVDYGDIASPGDFARQREAEARAHEIETRERILATLVRCLTAQWQSVNPLINAMRLEGLTKPGKHILAHHLGKLAGDDPEGIRKHDFNRCSIEVRWTLRGGQRSIQFRLGAP